jgi:patatin-related protein
MNATAPDASSSPERDDSYLSEVRFGVVMYGGVSLAIYINGVANELYEMACATPKVKSDVAHATREVYRKASFLLNNKELRDRYLEHASDPANTADPFADRKFLDTLPRTRFVVDVISGTSAGGINGAFLAKALANAQEFSPLKNLWIQDGDIDNLLNDDASYKDLGYAKNKNSPTRSLLNSDRMYIKLLQAFQEMKTAKIPQIGSESPLVDEIDLYMTTTDIRGSVVPLRLFDEVVYEKRFRQVYHFQYAAADVRTSQNDFADENAPFLAFASRCTSSFPFAFEPMTVDDAERLCKARLGGGGTNFDTWKSFFTGLSNDDLVSGRWRSRAFGDGGYLDNKPFSYVVDALSWRLGQLPMEHKLIYVEPAPAHPENDRQDFGDKPDAIENAFKALNTIPQYETIREDLEAVLTRNRRIERVERIVRQVEADIETSEAVPFERVKLVDGEVPPWTSLDMGKMIDYYGVSFLPYQRLRMASATDDIADRLAVWWDIDRDSDRFYALKAMARAWREAHYYENEDRRQSSQKSSVNKFLDEFDVKYRLRRVGFLLRKVHELLGLIAKLKQGKDESLFSDVEKRLLQRLRRHDWWQPSTSYDACIVALNCLARGFGEALQKLRAAAWMPAPLDTAVPTRLIFRNTLDRLLRLLMDEQLNPPLTMLAARDGTMVPVAFKELPPASRSRTLQENVMERTRALYEFAQGAKRTLIQDLLEEDLARLQNEYSNVMGSSNPGVPSARDLLGDPGLRAKSGAETGAELRIKDEVGFCHGALDTPEGRNLREFLAEYYLRFDEYDQMSFPLYYDTGTGEPSTVEVLRVSPEDARSLIDERNDRGDAGHQRRKLAGTALFNFGAFLDVRWRRNDIMWGRLDGCERLLAALFPEHADTPIRKALLQEAHLIILREEMQPEEYALLVEKFASALAEQKAEELEQAFDTLWEHLAPADAGQRNSRMAQALKALLGEETLIEYVRRYYEVDRKLDTEATMKTGARALTITGRILEESEKQHRKAGSSMVWVTRGGRALQALLTISTPGGLPHAVFRHWLGLLYVFELLIVAGAIAFSAPGARTFGLTCLGITVVLHTASLVAGDLMKGGPAWARRIAILLVLILVVLLLAVLGFAFFGATAWFNGSLCASKDLGWSIQAACRLGG